MTKTEIERALWKAEEKIMAMKRKLKAKRDVLSPEAAEATKVGIGEVRALCKSYRERLREIDGFQGQTR